MVVDNPVRCVLVVVGHREDEVADAPDETAELTVIQHRAQIEQQAQHCGALHVQQFVRRHHLRAEMSVAAHRLLGEADVWILKHAENHLSNLV